MKLLLIITVVFIWNQALYAKADEKESIKAKKKIVAKQRIQCNMTIKYKKRPKKVDNFIDIFTKGIFYGRFRTNNFFYDTKSTSYNIGGSLLFKSGRYNGLAFTTSLYTSKEIKDSKTNSMTAFAQNYLSFKKHRVELKLGRFLVETFMLKSHDAKMIPNAFQGAYLRISTIPKTKIVLAYLTKQKLPNHAQFHGVFSYNNDGAMHHGLSASKLKEEGIKDRIIVFEVKNRRIKNTQLRVGYTTVPKLLSLAVVEGAYKFKLDNEVKIKPAIRYMQQFDNGAGAIGGANLKNDTRGYKDTNSLESSLITGRIDFIFNSSSLRLGYSKVEDKGDIVAPWHGLPTAGYTRPMSGMNWYANSETFMIRADYDFPENSFFEGLHVMSRYAINNFDDKKTAVPADSNVFTFDLIKRFEDNPNLFLKLRSMILTEDHKVANVDGTFKKDPSYKALRLEMDYLF